MCVCLSLCDISLYSTAILIIFVNSNYHTMTKSTFLFVYIILILGSMVNEIQGQNAICQKFLSETDCGAGSCTALCLQLWKGIGKCIKTDDHKLLCLCKYECIV
ncbi:hypothetical protein AtEden1_Chr5g0132531 [Arabidopsis thaliana]